MKKAGEQIPSTVDGYIAAFPKATQHLLNTMRKTIKAAAPKAEELISYQMPAYKYHGILVYFAAHEKHIGFYATPTSHDAFNVAMLAEVGTARAWTAKSEIVK